MLLKFEEEFDENKPSGGPSKREDVGSVGIDFLRSIVVVAEGKVSTPPKRDEGTPAGEGVVLVVGGATKGEDLSE